jgi:hypothetical protein
MTYIVCGWYTPGYAHWLPSLQASLEAVGAPHDFVQVAGSGDGWEKTTMRKAGEVRAALNRHPDKTVIFIDVDCTVKGDLQRLANIDGDVGFFIRTRFRRNGTPKIGVRSGTLVFRPVERARRFVDAWIDEGTKAGPYSVDQDSLMVAMGRVPGLTITTIGVEYCATEGDHCPHPVIYHDRASRNVTKAGVAARFFSQWTKPRS